MLGAQVWAEVKIVVFLGALAASTPSAAHREPRRHVSDEACGEDAGQAKSPGYLRYFPEKYSASISNTRVRACKPTRMPM